MTRREIVAGLLPMHHLPKNRSQVSNTLMRGQFRDRLTTSLALIKSEQKTDNSGYKEEKSEEIEFADMLSEWLSVMRVQIKGKEQ